MKFNTVVFCENGSVQFRQYESVDGEHWGCTGIAYADSLYANIHHKWAAAVSGQDLPEHGTQQTWYLNTRQAIEDNKTTFNRKDIIPNAVAEIIADDSETIRLRYGQIFDLSKSRPRFRNEVHGPYHTPLMP